MEIVNYISNLAIPMIILIIVVHGVAEKKNVFDDFLEGAKDGLGIVVNIFPTLVGLFVAIGALRSSGIIDMTVGLVGNWLQIWNIPSEIMPLALLRPVSGSSSMAIATDIMKTYGVDSNIGNIASTIMGSTETTLYTIAIYTSCIKIKNTRFILIAALFADIVGILASIYICNFLN